MAEAGQIPAPAGAMETARLLAERILAVITTRTEAFTGSMLAVLAVQAPRGGPA